MFKISKMSLFSTNNKNIEYNLDSITYVYGDNFKGKTLFSLSLDFVLGSSSNILRKNFEGLENISAISCVITDGHKYIEFLRNIKDDYFLKYDQNSTFSLVDDEKYKNTITEIFTNYKSNQLELYKDLNGENLTCRSLSFINFLDETGIGNISTVFSRAHEKKHLFRFKNIMDFIFKFDYLEKLKLLERELDEEENKYNDIRKQFALIDNANNTIKELFSKYNITYGSLNENKNAFLKFKNGFKIEISAGSKQNLFRLMGLLNKVENQINAEIEMRTQSKILVEKNKKVEKIINDFSEILSGNDDYSSYKKEISKIISNNQYATNILNSKNYDETINNLNEEKKSITEKINKIANNLSGFELDEKLADIKLMQKAFDVLNSEVTINAVGIEENIKDIKSKIKKLNRQIRDYKNEEINDIITKMYLDSKLDISFINEDRVKKDFKIIFDSDSLSLNCYYKQQSKGEYNDKYFLPGSLARMTTMQIATYVSVHKFIKEKNIGLPLMQFICIDGLNQPFDESNEKSKYQNVLKLIMSYAQESNLQVIIISTVYDREIASLLQQYNVKEINLNNGFNPYHSAN